MIWITTWPFNLASIQKNLSSAIFKETLLKAEWKIRITINDRSGYWKKMESWLMKELMSDSTDIFLC